MATSVVDRIGLLALVIAGLVYLAAPILIVLPLAFNEAPLLSFPPSVWSLRWFDKLFGSAEWMGALLLSAQIAVGATAMSVALGLLLALGMVRHDIRGKRLIYGLVLMPLILPHIVTATAFLLFFSSLPRMHSAAAIAIAHGVLGVPLAVIIISASLQAMDSRLEQAAMSLGASATRAFLSVTLPNLAPAILSAALFGFLSSFDELLVALFLAEPGTQPLTVLIWKTVLYDLEPTVAAVSVLLIGLACIVVLISSLLSARRRSGSSTS